MLNIELASYLTAVLPTLRTAVMANAGPSRRTELVTRFGVDTLVDLIVISAGEQIANGSGDLTCAPASGSA